MEEVIFFPFQKDVTRDMIIDYTRIPDVEGKEEVRETVSIPYERL